jgi:hypothetical protein
MEFQEDPFTYTVRKRLREKRNTMVAAISDPRAGKTNAIMVVGEQVSVNRPFSHKDIAFLPYDYLKLIQKAEPGDFVQFDEPGAEWGARNFMSIENKMMNATHITFGSKYVNVGWAVPVLRMQDIISRMLLKYVFYMNTTGPRGMSRFYENWVNHYTGKQGRTRRGGCWFSKAFQDREEELKEYEEMKKEYQDKTYEKYYKEFQKADDRYSAKAEENLDRLGKAIAKVLEDPARYLNRKGRVDRDSIKIEFGLTAADARYVAEQANQKMEAKPNDLPRV